ncbi:carbohydrate ABC transporter permease [Paenibacillus radicis (ex Xue et al. 2023)]|uniref:Carbohydrate ABC transporter permease n=1 Tax=Paenibacillus radicis (ex Xue et al. 2023) TaxID=2972489 RepID=A0ABT1YAP0_9BACL|nr:carbohydrate ABC transporter permease [Paenibacillus radicis (ex Xue et al. 2023)]MCR8629967.1 carbohydrate ABC transporter permease [Paenibacillus radicis (ex Xue et al. 2023)]
MKEQRIGSDKMFTILISILSFIILLAVSYPLIYVISASFSSPGALMSGRVWLLPVEPGLEGYKAVVAYKNVWTGYANSLFYTIIGTCINVVLTIAAAYPLSRKDLSGRKFILLLFTFTMIFSGGMIPTYLLVKDLGLLNTRWALLIPNALSVFNVIVAMSFFRSNIPDELLESAKIDGCSNFRFMTSIVLPVSGAIIAVISLFYAVDHWNSFFDALLYLSDKNKYPLQIFLREILLLNTSDNLTLDVADQNQRLYLNELLKYSLIIFASLPLIITYPFVQKHFVKGVMIGSLKG